MISILCVISIFMSAGRPTTPLSDGASGRGGTVADSQENLGRPDGDQYAGEPNREDPLYLLFFYYIFRYVSVLHTNKPLLF